LRLNSGGWAPAGWTPEFFTQKLAVKSIPGSGVNAATVPGAISGYDALLKRFGTVTFNEAFERAARLAEEGWGLAERRHSDLRGAVNGLKADPDSRQTFLVNDQAPDLYSIIRNPGLAKALRIIQKQGRDGFYKGDVAAAIVAKEQANGGVMTLADLADFRSEWVEPVSTDYHGYDVFELPPFSTIMACSTSMIGAIEAAGMINGVDRNLALVGGVESLSRIQLGLGQSLSDWVRKFQQARSLGQKISHVSDLKLGDVKLYIPAVSNRTTGMSMGEHTEVTARQWQIGREEQDRVALESHQRAVAAWDRGFFDDLVIPIGDLRRDNHPAQRYVP